MKKILLTFLFSLMFCNICFASDKEITNKEYVSLLNNQIGEMKEITDIKEGSLSAALFKGIDNGYLIPDINRLEVLSESCKSLADNLKSIKLEDQSMLSKHNNLINKYYDVYQALNEVLDSKKDLLNKDINTFVKFGKLTMIDLTKTYIANEEINELNKLYKDIKESI